MSERLNRNTGVVGRRVDFTKRLPLSWGVEIDISLGRAEKHVVFERSKIKIPKHINNIKFLDLNPQESLPVPLRNIRSDFEEYQATILNFLADSSLSQREYETRKLKVMGNLFKLFFWKNDDEAKYFNKTLSGAKGQEIVIIEAHGNDDLFIGEQYSHDPERWEDQKYQSEGNQIAIQKILRRYSDVSKYAAVLLISCYVGEKELKPVGVPMVYINGEIEHTTGSSRKKYHTLLVVPKSFDK